MSRGRAKQLVQQIGNGTDITVSVSQSFQSNLVEPKIPLCLMDAPVAETLDAENDDTGIIESIDAFQRIIDLFDSLFCVSCVHCTLQPADESTIVG